MPTRNTGSAIKDLAGNNATKSHLSTNIIIKVDGLVIGAVKSIRINEQRTIGMVAEVGTDGFIDSAPTRSTEISGSCTRTRFNRKRMLEAFGRGYTHIHAQRLPFDIEIHDIFADADQNNAIITVVENVWFESLNYTYDSEAYLIMEDCNFKAERIYSLLNGGNVVTSVGNGDGSPIILDVFELEADRGAFSGSLDSAGLLNAFLDDPRA